MAEHIKIYRNFNIIFAITIIIDNIVRLLTDTYTLSPLTYINIILLAFILADDVIYPTFIANKLKAMSNEEKCSYCSEQLMKMHNISREDAEAIYDDALKRGLTPQNCMQMLVMAYKCAAYKQLLSVIKDSHQLLKNDSGKSSYKLIYRDDLIQLIKKENGMRFIVKEYPRGIINKRFFNSSNITFFGAIPIKPKKP